MQETILAVGQYLIDLGGFPLVSLAIVSPSLVPSLVIMVWARVRHGYWF